MWLVDSQNPGAAVLVDYAIPFSFHPGSDSYGLTHLVILSGTRVLFTDVQQTPEPVNRQIAVDGTPSRILLLTSSTVSSCGSG